MRLLNYPTIYLLTNMLKNILILFFLFSFNANANQDLSHAKFFGNLKSLCEQSFIGKTFFPTDKKDPFVGVKLTINFSSCSKDEIRVSFKVAKDTSRTWVITNTEKGLLLKHDHRHEDGTPDKVTMYGGYADINGNALTQAFFADAHTSEMIPAAKTNIWQLSFNQSKSQLTYSLQRNSAPRYKAIFELLPIVNKEG